MFNLGFQEILIIGILAVILFGRRLPEVARSLGQSYHQFKRGLNDLKREMDDVVYTTNTEIRTSTAALLEHTPETSADFEEPAVQAYQPSPAPAADSPGDAAAATAAALDSAPAEGAPAEAARSDAAPA